MKHVMQFKSFVSEKYIPNLDGQYISGNDLKNKQDISIFIKYNRLDKSILDIWEYMANTFNVYPIRIVATMGMIYYTPTGSKIEIEFKNGRPTELYSFNGDRLIGNKTFSFDELNKMYK